MAEKEEIEFFCIFKEEKIDFQTMIERVFLEFIQEKNKNESSNDDC